MRKTHTGKEEYSTTGRKRSLENVKICLHFGGRVKNVEVKGRVWKIKSHMTSVELASRHASC